MVDSVSRRLCRLIAAQKSRAYFGSQTRRGYESPALDFYWSRALRPQPWCVSEPNCSHHHHPRLAWALPQLGTGCDRKRRPTAVTATGSSVEIQHKGIVDICIPTTTSTQAEAMVPQFRPAKMVAWTGLGWGESSKDCQSQWLVPSTAAHPNAVAKAFTPRPPLHLMLRHHLKNSQLDRVAGRVDEVEEFGTTLHSNHGFTPSRPVCEAHKPAFPRSFS